MDRPGALAGPDASGSPADAPDPSQAAALVRAGFERLRQGHADAAAEIAASVLADSPVHHGALNLAALVALERGQSEEAQRLLEDAVTLHPEEPVYHCNLSVALCRNHLHAEAIEAARRASRLRPGYLRALLNEGDAHFSSGDFEAALGAFERALAVEPEHTIALAYRGDALRSLGRVRAAIASYERALALEPDQAHATANLGLTLFGVGHPERALELTRRATEIAPREPDAWMNLGATLRNLGRIADAMDAYAEAYELAPESAPLRTRIAQLWLEVNDLPQALRWYDAALSQDPTQLDARCGLAAALRHAGETTAALARYREIAEEHPGEAVVHEGLAATLWEDGDAAAAIEACRRVIEARPEDAAAIAKLGTIQASAGDVAGANATNRRALEVDPRCIPALANLAQNLRGELPRADARAMEALLDAEWPREGARSSLHFGLAHHYDGSGEFSRAAAHAADANRLHLLHKRERGWNYDPNAHRAAVDAVIEAFSPEFFERTRGMGDPSEAPVFVVGMPRSGTTLTEQILSTHPRVFGAGERNFTALGFERLRRQAGGDAEAGLSWLARVEAKPLRDAAAWHLGRLHELVDKATRIPGSSERIVDKMPDNYSQLGWIATAFPNARIIHCRRDLRDVALSCWMTPFKEIRWAFDLEHIAARIVQYERLMAHWRRTLPVPILELDYEETVAHQAEESARLVDFVGLPWDERCLDFHRNERLVRTASVTQVRQPIYSRSVARWRHYEDALQPLLDHLAKERSATN